jgi:Rps23 Pro-64 3,4-dihydroxylase Tpa1-like proline 4-hydroxylase
MTKWYDLPRNETTQNRLPDNIINNNISVINLEYGINLYRNAITKDKCNDVINNIESAISEGNPLIFWRGAQVNAQENIDDVRNCVDLKFKEEHLGTILPENKKLSEAYSIVKNSLDLCMRNYESLWHLQMQYYEAFNFVKYSPGKYFKIHADHGPYYTCTVSAVVYLNDDYEGGEIDFIRHGIKIKPQAGDIVIFPSNFVYEHASCEVFSGNKYSVVIMTDYNDSFHKNEYNTYNKGEGND